MARRVGILVLGVVLTGCWGCGGGDAKKDTAAGGSGSTGAGSTPPSSPPGGSMGPPGGGMGPPGGGMGPPSTAPSAAPAVASASAAGTSANLMQFMPETVKVAVGANLTALRNNDTPFAPQIMGQLRPILAMLERAGVKESQIEQFWSGTDRDKDEFLVCVRTKEDYAPSAITKKLEAAEKGEKIGKASVHKIGRSQSSGLVIENAVAYVDTKTLLLGRYKTVAAGLNDPKPGSIQNGIDAMAAPNAYFWISGGDLATMRQLNLRGLEGLNWMTANTATPQAQSIGFSRNEGEGAIVANSGGGGPGMGGPPGGPMGGPPGGPGVGPPLGGPGRGPGGSGMGPPGGGPGMGGGGGGNGPDKNRPLLVSSGWAFRSVEAAKVMEVLLQLLIDESNKKNTGTGPGGPMGPPGGSPGGPGGPGGPPGGPGGPPGGPGGPPGGPGGPPGGPGGPRGGPNRGRGGRRGITTTTSPQILDDSLFDYQAPGGPPGGPGGPPGGPGGPPGGPPGGGPPGMGNQNQDDPNVTYYHLALNGSNLKLTYSVPKDDFATVGKLLGRALETLAAPPLDDGLFGGNLALLGQGFQKWEQSAPADRYTGYRKAGGDVALQHYSWLTELLPHIGYETIYNKFEFDKEWDHPINTMHAQALIPAFLNAADPRKTWNIRGLPPMGITHFAGMAGVEDKRNVVAAMLPRTDPRAGIFGYNGNARISDITDGTSNTILMIGTGQVAAPWVMGGGATIRGARREYFDKLTGFGSRGLSSPGAYVLMADGSARVIHDTIDPNVFKAMCTIHDGANEPTINLNDLAGKTGN